MKKLLVALLCIASVSAFADNSCKTQKEQLKGFLKTKMDTYKSNQTPEQKIQILGKADLDSYNLIMANQQCFPKLVKRMQKMQDKLDD